MLGVLYAAILTPVGRVFSALVVCIIALISVSAWAYLAGKNVVSTRVELAVMAAELEEVQRRAAILETINKNTHKRVEQAEQLALAMEEKIKAYEKETAVNPDCLVDERLIDWLHNNPDAESFGPR